jgi:hypothetical protein
MELCEDEWKVLNMQMVPGHPRVTVRQLASYFPRKLRELTVRLPCKSADPSLHVHLLMATIGALRPLQSLSLDIPSSPSHPPVALGVAYLSRHSNTLRRLYLDGIAVNAALCQVIRRCHKLTCLRIGHGTVSSADLMQLFQGPEKWFGELQRVLVDTTVLSLAHLNCLALIPSLDSLNPACFMRDAIPRLSAFAKLQYLNIHIFDADSIPATVLIPHLQALTLLQGMKLQAVWFSEVSLGDLAFTLPALSSLTLYKCTLPTNMRGLHRAPQLSALNLTECSSLRAATLLSLRDVLSLRHLTVDLPEGEVEFASRVLTPPSLHLPQLTDVQFGAIDEENEFGHAFDDDEEEEGFLDDDEEDDD